jgi:type II secretory ATPase GspE/PulE/Tfp pilus assembly ATPase PilB-like protein
MPSRLLGHRKAIEALAEEADEQISDLVDAILHAAMDLEATDIHFDPTGEGLVLNMRIESVLYNVTTLAPHLTPYVTNRLKVLADLATQEARHPQEGHFRFEHHEGLVEVRLSTYPTAHGEEFASVRIFRPQKELWDLDKLGLPQVVRDELDRVSKLQDGLVLLAGPGNSGKTTTLYATMSHILGTSNQTRRLATVEDPIENVLPGVMQTQVRRRDGMDFGQSLHSLLRHDIDVIMVGEIRDAETANVAVEASLTGHLVLSTIHAARAAAVPTRLLEMEVPPYTLTGGLRLVVAQRLLRRLHPQHTRELSEEEVRRLPVEAGPEVRAVDTDSIEHSMQAYAGVLLLAEHLTNTEELRQAVMDRASYTRFEEILAEQTKGLPAQAIDSLRAGETPWAEVQRTLAGQLGEVFCPLPGSEA